MVKSLPGATFHEPRASVRPKAHVLVVVDDDELIAASLAQSLHTAGHEAKMATSFQVALDVLDGPGPLDLLITDLVMPDQVNGIALARMARLRRADLKIVYMTGYDLPDIAHDQVLGPILRKPVPEAVLLEQVERALGTP
jgi:DNA-binding NtrC family response regulator